MKPLSAEHKALCQSLEKTLLSSQGDDDASHGVHHARRVLESAITIAEGENNANLKLLTAGAYLHDLVNVPKDSPLRSKASQLSADAAEPILQDLNFSDQEISDTQHMIVTHSFSADQKPQSLEARILQDADRLEAIGAIGIARVFYIAGKLDSELFEGEDPFAQHRDLNDKQYALDHFKVKLLGLADTMQTASGRRLAMTRTATMRSFLDAIADELCSANPW